MKGKFHNIINRTIVDDHRHRYIQVNHHGQLYRVDIADTDAELAEVKALDDQFFKGPQQLTAEELKLIPYCGHILYYRSPESEEVVAASQILFQSISRQEVRMHEAFLFGTVGRGYGPVMYKAQEVVTREAGKRLIRASVRVENTETIRAQLKAGFRITEYDRTRYGLREHGGARFVMVKDLINEQMPFRPVRQAEDVKAGLIPIIDTPQRITDILRERPYRVGVFVLNIDHFSQETHEIIDRVILSDYTGIAVLQPSEYGAAPGPRKLLIFQRNDVLPGADRLTLPVNVHSEFGALQEVIVSYTPENAQIREEYAINEVARKNVNNIDPIAFKDEYNLFVGTLMDHGARVVRTNAIGRGGKTPVFTRDPSFTLGNVFVIGNLKQHQRVYELDGMREVSILQERRELQGIEGAFVEGGDVIFIGPKKLAVGIGQRTNMAGLERLQEAFPEYTFIGVPHSDLHLDVLFTVVGEKKCLADVSQLPDDFLEMLRNDGYTIIVADPDEQGTLGCNVVCLDDGKVVAVRENTATNQRLRENGIEVIEVSMPNVVKWGGGPRCMTCPTHRL